MSSNKFSNVKGYTTHSQIPSVFGDKLNDYHPAIDKVNTDTSKFRLSLTKSFRNDYFRMTPDNSTGWSPDHLRIFTEMDLVQNQSDPNCIETELDIPVNEYLLSKFKLIYTKENEKVVYQAELRWEMPSQEKFEEYSKWFWIPDDPG
jgi:hypothetical protein